MAQEWKDEDTEDVEGGREESPNEQVPRLVGVEQMPPVVAIRT